MTVQEAIQILKEHNKWRRSNEIMPRPMVNPTELGIAIDTVVNHFDRKQHLADIMKADEKEGLYKTTDVNINPYSARDMAKRRKK